MLVQKIITSGAAMVKPTSPTAAFVKASVQGSRTGVQLPNKGSIPTLENGMEDPESYWDSAKTPNEKQQDAETSDKAKQRLKDKNSEKPVAEKPRYSLPGQQTGEDESEDNAGEKAEHILQHVHGNRSPSEMSRVSTAPPTPNSVVTQREESPEDDTPLSPPEGVRASPDEEQEEVVVPQARVSSPTGGTMPSADAAADEDFPVDNDDDMPSPPPPETQDTDLSMREEEVPPTQEEVEFPADMDDDDDDDDDDKEGPGYAIVHDPETPESVRAERLKEEQELKKKSKRKTTKKKKDTSTVASRSSKSTKSSKPAAKATKQRKSKKKVTFPGSPMGYPAGNREYEVIPVSNFKESPEEGVRRSRRARVKPLAFWKNERPQYEAHHEEGTLGEAMGLMPVVAGYISAQPTPYKKRKAPAAASKGGSKQKKAKKGQKGSASVATVEEVDETPFDSRKLRKKYKIVDGEEANMWDESADDAIDHKVVSYADKMVATDLPLPATRKKSEGKIVGKASQAFNVPTDDNNVGYIMGSLFLPPGGIKDPESSGPCSLSFTVSQGQPKAVEVAFGDPNDEDGELNPKNAQRFLLGPGDMFRVMPGNCYRLENHSKTSDCLLSWTIIRPRRNASDA